MAYKMLYHPTTLHMPTLRVCARACLCQFAMILETSIEYFREKHQSAEDGHLYQLIVMLEMYIVLSLGQELN
jgi:hypothetical protein